MIVIVEIFSRYVWMQPCRDVREVTVSKAFEKALLREDLVENKNSRNESKQFYEFLKDKIQIVTVDGGYEFQ